MTPYTSALDGVEEETMMEDKEIEEDRCPDCGSTEAGSCFYCKAD
jgi:hypothetical protein